MHTARRAWFSALVILLVAVLAACGGGGGVSRSEFEDGLAERNGLTHDEAVCVTDYVYDGYSEAEIETIHEDGILDLPSARWQEYVLGLVGCSLHDELGVESS